MCLQLAVHYWASRAKQSKAEQSRAKQSNAVQSRAKQSKAEQAEQAEQSRAKQSKAEQAEQAQQSKADRGWAMQSLAVFSSAWQSVVEPLLLSCPLTPLTPGKYVLCCYPLVVQCDGCLVLGGRRVAMDTSVVGWYCLWWPLPSPGTYPQAHQSMGLMLDL